MSFLKREKETERAHTRDGRVTVSDETRGSGLGQPCRGRAELAASDGSSCGAPSTRSALASRCHRRGRGRGRAALRCATAV
jgi:hypothetical protein